MEQNFLGKGWGFPPEFSKVTGGVRMVSGVEDIGQSLGILLSTHIGERVMEPRYGCNMTKLLFEPVDTTMRTYMKELIEYAILYFEPRVLLNDVILLPRPEEGRIDIEILYTIRATNSRYNYVYPFYLAHQPGEQA